ncbi:MAG: hypothetical protein LLF94_05735, partial [Chlamydiales bacterium]|nr:hypothetical protein [Chlamydiales bacterium]
YVLLERDAQAIQTATNLLEGDDRLRCVQTDVVKDEKFFTDPQKTQALQPESVYLCLGSGALTKCVLKTKREAFIVLHKIQRYLMPGGYLLLAGLADSWFVSNEFSTHGFTVLNTFCPSKEQPFYVLQKPFNLEPEPK